MYYDHLLAAGWEEYSSVSLEEFTRSRYDLLLSYAGVIPARSQRILQHMSEHNWLLSYRSLDGLHQALTVCRSAPLLSPGWSMQCWI
jgi:acyl carrier protein phosphodiesterase